MTDLIIDIKHWHPTTTATTTTNKTPKMIESEESCASYCQIINVYFEIYLIAKWKYIEEHILFNTRAI
jgi:hypothetical protein